MFNFILLMLDNISMNYFVIDRNFIKYENEYIKKIIKLKLEKVIFKYD